MTCPKCTGPLVQMLGEGVAICSDCKRWTDTERPSVDSARAKKRSMKLGDKQNG